MHCTFVPVVGLTVNKKGWCVLNTLFAIVLWGYSLKIWFSCELDIFIMQI